MGCESTMAEAEKRERETALTEITADWPGASEGPQGASVLPRAKGFSRTRTDLGRPWVDPTVCGVGSTVAP